MKSTLEIPDDPALPALAAIRAAGVAAALPALDWGDGPIELRLRGYTPGSRATFEARAGNRRCAIKAYAEDPAPEAALYKALGAAGLAGPSGARAPQLLAWERDLRALVLAWLEGPAANELVKEGHGARAGELAARWLWRAASLAVKLGPSCGAGYALYAAGRSVAELTAAEPALGAAARTVAGSLAQTQPKDNGRHLVHGTFYARHVLDMGDGPGVVDWQRFGQGPIELDAAMFLATLSRLGLRHEPHAAEAARAEEAFLSETAGLFDAHTLAWHRGAALLHLAARLLKREPPVEAHALVGLAAAFAAAGAHGDWVSLPEASPAFVLRALSTTRATPQELDQLRRLLDEMKGR